ncbi:PPR repeat [Musa troglodytarum]|uniref:PPR repeat n=1 Tax=Musa troglodytarum TaxID=320322 RepID=A0A9E7HNW4_9LILI|nr:PPR repeat [Musa troglodytarum]
MPMKPKLAILGALLSACRAQNDLELGELVAKKIESLCQCKGGADVLLSSIYADQQRWHGVVSVREAARKDANKPPAQSWI